MGRLLGAIGGALLLSAGTAFASDESTGVPIPSDEMRSAWSLTAIGQYTRIPSPEDDDGVGGWFDQYEYTPNKGSEVPFQLGIRDAKFDLFRGQTAVFQSRLHSPTSNLGVSGPDLDEPFFNQRLEALTRLEGFDFDLSYRRIRTEQLRLFPNTQGPGLVFADRSDRNDRFYRDRTGFLAEVRLRPYDVLDASQAAGSWLRPELSVRGGYEARGGDKQIRFLRAPTNQWLGVTLPQDRAVSEVGGGLLVAPDGLLTVSLDFDYERLRFEDPVFIEAQLGFAPPQATRTVGYTPETDRTTGAIRFNSRILDRAVLEGGFLFSELEQVSTFTPAEQSAGLDHNAVRSYAANAALDLRLTTGLSLNGVFKYDRRETRIDRNTSLFNAANQIYPFVEHWERFFVRGELDLRFWRSSLAGFGIRYEDVSREIDYGAAGSPRVLPENALVDRNTRIITAYGRIVARPLPRMRINAELGYRWAPDTGYAMDLDNNLYGELRTSYTVLVLERPILFSGYVRGGTGSNRDFTMVSGQGPVPAGSRLPRSYDRSHLVTGTTVSVSPIDRLTLSASVFYSRDDQNTSLDFSTIQRYFQEFAPVAFSREGTTRFDNEQISLLLGVHARLTKQTDASIGYSFTRVAADYRDTNAALRLELIRNTQRVRSNAHELDLELRHRIVDGLEVLGGYRYQLYHDESPKRVSVASAVAPFDRSTHQHTVTVGVTLTSAFFER